MITEYPPNVPARLYSFKDPVGIINLTGVMTRLSVGGSGRLLRSESVMVIKGFMFCCDGKVGGIIIKGCIGCIVRKV
jgi:hypothetical protein